MEVELSVSVVKKTERTRTLAFPSLGGVTLVGRLQRNLVAPDGSLEEMLFVPSVSVEIETLNPEEFASFKLEDEYTLVLVPKAKGE